MYKSMRNNKLTKETEVLTIKMINDLWFKEN